MKTCRLPGQFRDTYGRVSVSIYVLSSSDPGIATFHCAIRGMSILCLFPEGGSLSLSITLLCPELEVGGQKFHSEGLRAKHGSLCL